MQTLIVCEKPDAAARVARALDEDGDPRRVDTHGVPLYESRSKNETIFVCSALGHLYAVSGKSSVSRRYYPVWDYSWKPKNLVDKQSARLAKWIQVINTISKKTGRFVNACDYDIEGSLIGYTILRYACNQAHAKAERMKFSTMTEKELQIAYRNLSPKLDFSQADAGQCRHELDWLYGINLTRLLTESSLKQNRGYLTLSTGRVQGPTLKFVVDREEEIQCFAPTPFWTIDAAISHDGNSYHLEYEKQKILVRGDALRVVGDCTNALLSVADKESRSTHQSPLFPFDLSTLQGEAYRHFGYSPSRTLALAERLYLDAVISYPRTSSQQLPSDIDYTEILRGIARNPQYGRLANKLAKGTSLHPNNGPKVDPAHPAIYPTGETPKRSLIHPEANLLDLIIRRFMATFAEPSFREITKLTLAKEPHRFFLRGSRLITEGWVEYYRPYTSDESNELPNLKTGDQVKVQTIEATEKFTDPPPRYNPSSLLRKMEEENIGTKATRAEIIEILYRRGYIKETRMEATRLAIKIISILDKYCPLITDVRFTAQLESQMEKIQSDDATRLSILTEALEHLRPVILDLISRESEIGTQLSEVIVSQRVSDTTFMIPCPSCSSKLRIIRSRASGKRFIGCQGYQQGCRFTLPLPQFGTITMTRNKCKTCGFQLISVRSKTRRSLMSCPRCYITKMKERQQRSCRTRAKARLPRGGLLLEAPTLVKHQQERQTGEEHQNEERCYQRDRRRLLEHTRLRQDNH